MIDRDLVSLQRRLDVLEGREPPLAGMFVTTALATTDDMLVISPGWDDGEHTFGPVRWSPIGGALPQAGDECVIMERDDGVWQVVGWWSDSQGTGVDQATVDALDARVDALETDRTSGSTTATWTAAIRSANKVIAHGLGVTPSIVEFTSAEVDITYALVSKDATNVTARGYYLPGTSLSGPFAFDWAAFK